MSNQISCKLCDKELEVYKHFLLNCQRLEHTRQKHKDMLISTLMVNSIDFLESLTKERMVQPLVDCTILLLKNSKNV